MSTNEASTNLIQVSIDLSNILDDTGIPVVEYIRDAIKDEIVCLVKRKITLEAQEKKHILEAIIREEMDRIAWPTAQEVIDDYKKKNNV